MSSIARCLVDINLEIYVENRFIRSTPCLLRRPRTLLEAEAEQKSVPIGLLRLMFDLRADGSEDNAFYIALPERSIGRKLDERFQERRAEHLVDPKTMRWDLVSYKSP
jgi:hypothetical protein